MHVGLVAAVRWTFIGLLVSVCLEMAMTITLVIVLLAAHVTFIDILGFGIIILIIHSCEGVVLIAIFVHHVQLIWIIARSQEISQAS